MNLRLLLSAFACVVAFALASSALAQDGKGNTPEYRQLVDQAVEEFQRGNWDEASGLFEQAHQLNPNARTLRGMGLSAFEGRRYVAALKHLEASLNEPANALTAQQRTEVQATVERAQRYVAKLQLTIEPANAEVTINGVPVEHNGAQTVVLLDPGMVELRATSPGHQLEMRQLRMVSGAQQTLDLRLNPQSAAVQPGPGGAAPAAPVAGGSSTSSLAVWKWVTAGAAVVGFGVAVPAFLVSSSAADDWNNDPVCRAMPDPEKAEGSCGDRRDDFQRMEAVGVISLIAGSVFAATSITLFVIDGVSSGESASATAGTTACGAGVLSVSCKVAF